MTSSFLEEIITLSNEVFKDFESDMVVRMGQVCNPARETAESIITVKQSAGFYILAPQLQAKMSDL